MNKVEELIPKGGEGEVKVCDLSRGCILGSGHEGGEGQGKGHVNVCKLWRLIHCLALPPLCPTPASRKTLKVEKTWLFSFLTSAASHD